MDDNELNNKQRNLSSFSSYALHKCNVFVCTHKSYHVASLASLVSFSLYFIFVSFRFALGLDHLLAELLLSLWLKLSAN